MSDKPSLEKLLQAKFNAADDSFTITVREADHALHHFLHLLPLAAGKPDARQAEAGIMGACLSHALGWTAERGKEAMVSNVPFQRLIEIMIDLHYELALEAILRTINAELS